MTTVLSFLLVLGVLVAIHEWGHYRMAVACGVKVLRFSVGFGKPIFTHKSPATGTEYTLGWIPLGGFVKMLDEREAPVEASLRGQAFNNQPLRSRVAIVAAGPLANLVLAVLLYAAVGWMGLQVAAPVLSAPVQGSLAERAGLQAQDRVLSASRIGVDGERSGDEPIESFENLNWRITQAALNRHDLALRVQRSGTNSSSERVLTTRQVDAQLIDAKLMRQIGVMAPFSPPVLGEITPDSAAQRAGLQLGDRVQAVDNRAVFDAFSLREHIRATPEQRQVWRVERGGQSIELSIAPARVAGPDNSSVGRIGAVVGQMPEMLERRLGPIEGLAHGVQKTWEMAALSLKLLGRIVIGEASVKNLSGPLTIADYAGKSAQLGLVSLLGFMALVSVSLGVLNLLPLPVLDGGHLMYYLWEGVRGKPVSDLWQERFQRGGMAILMLMMSVALFNDFSRLLG